MILQTLTQHYETLVQIGILAGPGWKPVKASYAFFIAVDGALEQVTSTQTEQFRGKKTVFAPQVLTLPAPVKCIAGIATSPLCNDSGCILGTDSKGNPQHSLTCFVTCKAPHTSVLGDVVPPSAQALLTFFRIWILEHTLEHPALAEYRENILSGANLPFRYNGNYVREDPEIRRAWERHYHADIGNPRGICLVAGEEKLVESVHPAIRGVSGTQSSDAALVLFNAPAFCSYGKEQDLNAPTDKYVASTYTATLNYLLADREHVYRFGDAIVVCQTRGDGDVYQAFFDGVLLGVPTPYSAADLHGMTAQLYQGILVNFQEDKFDPSMDLYIPGLSPNAARLSVRFSLHDAFQGFLDYIRTHYDRLGIARFSDNKSGDIPLWHLLYTTVQNRTKYEPGSYGEVKQDLERCLPPELSGEILHSILMNVRYLATLPNGTTLHIRTKHEITRSRAAVIKVCLLQNYRSLPIYSALEEVLTMELNDSCNHQSYVLG